MLLKSGLVELFPIIQKMKIALRFNLITGLNKEFQKMLRVCDGLVIPKTEVLTAEYYALKVLFCVFRQLKFSHFESVLPSTCFIYLNSTLIYTQVERFIVCIHYWSDGNNFNLALSFLRVYENCLLKVFFSQTYHLKSRRFGWYLVQVISVQVYFTGLQICLFYDYVTLLILFTMQWCIYKLLYSLDLTNWLDLLFRLLVVVL